MTLYKKKCFQATIVHISSKIQCYHTIRFKKKRKKVYLISIKDENTDQTEEEASENDEEDDFTEFNEVDWFLKIDDKNNVIVIEDSG